MAMFLVIERQINELRIENVLSYKVISEVSMFLAMKWQNNEQEISVQS